MDRITRFKTLLMSEPLLRSFHLNSVMLPFKEPFSLKHLKSRNTGLHLQHFESWNTAPVRPLHLKH
jgi:hypothetical protein